MDSEAVYENQTPPEGYEPQSDLGLDQTPDIVERDSVAVSDVEEEFDNDPNFDGLAADDDDDYAEDGDVEDFDDN
jgi:hypothetical protein